MKIYDKLAQLKKTVQEIKNISEKSGNDNVFQTEIDDLNDEIMRLKKGITQTVEELEKSFGEENA